MYASRAFSLLLTLAFLLFQTLPLFIRLFALVRNKVDTEMAKALFGVSIVLELLLLRISLLFAYQLRHCDPLELRLLRTVYQHLFRQVERTTEGHCTW